MMDTNEHEPGYDHSHDVIIGLADGPLNLRRSEADLLLAMIMTLAKVCRSVGVEMHPDLCVALAQIDIWLEKIAQNRAHG